MRRIKSWVAGFAALSLISMSLPVTNSAFAGVLVNDFYVGSNRNVDVYGNDAVFNTHSVEVDVTSTQIQFTVDSNFIGFVNNSSKNFGARLGDMFFQFTPYDPFISPGSVAPNYLLDDMSNGNKWDYAIRLEGLPTTGFGVTPDSGGVSLYSIDGSSQANYDADIISSTEFWTTNGLSGTVRDNQEVLVDTDVATKITTIEGGGWSIDPLAADNKLTITLEADMLTVFGYNVSDGGTVALHWGMTCANDTIEGEAPIPAESGQVPEPATAFAFGFGLLGLVITGRRRNAKKNA